MCSHSRHLTLLAVVHGHLHVPLHTLASHVAASQAHLERNPFFGILWLSKAWLHAGTKFEHHPKIVPFPHAAGSMAVRLIQLSEYG